MAFAVIPYSTGKENLLPMSYLSHGSFQMCRQNWHNLILEFANVTTTVNEMENSKIYLRK